MNTAEVETRLEGLASASANPDVPIALWNRLAELETIETSAATPTALSSRTGFRRVGGMRPRGLLLIGLAASLSLIGGIVFVVGNHSPQPSPTPLRLVTATGSSAPRATPQTPGPQATAPVSTGAFTKIHEFTGSSAQYQDVSLSWQDNQIVGIANGVDSFGLWTSCVLRSPDGIAWTCSELPKPAGIAPCGPDSCFYADLVAVSGGHWVAVGHVDPRLTNGGADSAPGPVTTLTWTSSDGITWKEQPKARIVDDFSVNPDVLRTGNLLPTADGFAMSGARVNASPTTAASAGPVLWTTVDGTSWKPATFRAGSEAPTLAFLAYDRVGGFLATGLCGSGDSSHVCTVSSTDGRTWATGDVGLGAQYSPYGAVTGHGPVYAGGRWVLNFIFEGPPDQYKAGDPIYYVASSPDGLTWTLSPSSAPPLMLRDSKAVRSNIAGLWAMDGDLAPVIPQPGTSPAIEQPDFTPSLYWSSTGFDWLRVVAAPPVGLPMALVETPTQVIALMVIAPNSDNSTVSVWAAPKK